MLLIIISITPREKSFSKRFFACRMSNKNAINIKKTIYKIFQIESQSKY